ncbi:MAG TPA: hypothetical protein VNW97_02880 [Candidatus Saccharimonadales bacterium]|nr:hypothetical protein [Candidatus Saccharimonadales bacterium]
MSGPNASHPMAAYYDGAGIVFTPAVTASRTVAALGPWVFGARLSEDKPLDKRLNLYVVVPGKQHQSPGGPEYDHNMVVNAVTGDKVREWDIYWCFKIDPSLNDDLRSEHDVIVAAQEFFKPADLFDMEDVPGRAALAEKTGVRILADLKHFRRKDGALPRMLIIPARQAISATADTGRDEK